MTHPTYHWHIFCRVIDNFGDIGVCWRLAKQLTQQGQSVHLWVDDLISFQALCPTVSPHLTTQQIEGIELFHWQTSLHDTGIHALAQAQIVIEAFGCTLPEVVLDILRSHTLQPLWINLEYLSAEPWVEGVHGLPSPVHQLDKYFFFPGFTERTGGLLWEKELLNLPQQLQHPEPRAQLFKRLGLNSVLAELPLHISLFAYENPQLPALLTALSEHSTPVHVLVPQGRISQAVEAWLGQPCQLQHSYVRQALTLSTVPFMSHPLYDQLLATCQLNFVRGEESFVRAQMLGLPMIWHIYQQEDNVHLDKLHAFLHRYLESYPSTLKALLTEAFTCWSQGSDASPQWTEILHALPEWHIHTQRWQARQQTHGSLAENLLIFAATRYNPAHF